MILIRHTLVRFCLETWGSCAQSFPFMLLKGLTCFLGIDSIVESQREQETYRRWLSIQPLDDLGVKPRILRSFQVVPEYQSDIPSATIGGAAGEEEINIERTLNYIGNAYNALGKEKVESIALGNEPTVIIKPPANTSRTPSRSNTPS